jgi:hypothetical protein
MVSYPSKCVLASIQISSIYLSLVSVLSLGYHLMDTLTVRANHRVKILMISVIMVVFRSLEHMSLVWIQSGFITRSVKTSHKVI